MQNLIRSVKAATLSGKETLVKNNITTQLSNTVKELQLYTMEDNMCSDSLQVSEAETTLCTVIEAIFLHGLKDSLVHRARRAIADVDERPQPHFWSPLLVISHRQIIDQIMKLPQITTEIGQCRAWIRIALNDGLLSSYLSSMHEDSSALKSYYNSDAYIRDNELLDVARRLIEGIETFTDFTLPTNSSLLNTWQLQSLVLAGIWSPTLRSSPIAAGVDVAQSLQSTSAINSETDSLSSAMSFNSSTGIGPILAMNEDEALKIILGKHMSEKNLLAGSNFKPSPENLQLNTSDLSDIDSRSAGSESNYLSESNVGNSLNRRSGWSFCETDDNSDQLENKTFLPTSTPTINIETPKSTETSYNALIENYNLFGGSFVKTLDVKEVWQNLERKTDVAASETKNLDATPIENISSIVETEIVPLSSHIGQVANERGLDYQNYECVGCRKPLSFTPKPKTCGFTAEYLCDGCMSTESVQIPARIIHNWDFRTYEVSQKSLNYINEIKQLPMIDLKVVNPYIYTVSEDMSKLQMLRIQLNFLRDYLYTCREPVIEELQKHICGKDYMYQHVHQYSILDLSQIRSGALIQYLQKVVNYGTKHVENCWLCSQKGFICEICNKSKVLYPFDVEYVYRCAICNAVYHNSCFSSNKSCPKCKRRKEREDLPLLGATIE